MIIQTTRISRTGGVANLANHLLDKLDENDAVEILAGDRNALFDAHHLAAIKGCRYSLRHFSISPEGEMSPGQLGEFIRSLDDEFQIGPHRPRLVVRHIKKGRSHFHLAIAEVDPSTLRVLDCRNDFARLEALARRYELTHNETLQPTRSERRLKRVEGFSDVSRKRAERHAPAFDRTKLKRAYSTDIETFFEEVARQKLRLVEGEKGPVLVTSTGTFVAAANRAVGARRAEFLKFIEACDHHARQLNSSSNTEIGRAEHRAAFAPAVPDAGARRTRSGIETARALSPDPANPASASRRIGEGCGPSRSLGSPLRPGRRSERLFLYKLGKLDLDELLRLAEELAAWMMSIFEPPRARLTRRIDELKRTRGRLIDAEPPTVCPLSLNLRSGMKP